MHQNGCTPGCARGGRAGEDPVPWGVVCSTTGYIVLPERRKFAKDALYEMHGKGQGRRTPCLGAVLNASSRLVS
eukprot:1157718-Pelagomonas_calceolata.AAC.6